MKKILLIITLVLILLLPFVFQTGQSEETFFSMDTVITLKLKGDSENLDEAKKIIEDMHKRYNAYDEASLVSGLNKNGKCEKDPVLERAKELYVATEGAFDPTLKALTDLWNINGESPKVPSAEEIKEALSRVGGENLICGDEIYLKNGVTADLGGIVKGYATDEVVKMLKANNCKEFVLNLGGNIYAYSENKPLKIGVQEPFSARGELLFTLEISDSAVVSSGTYERYFEEKGRSYHHIFDTKTGYPAETGISQVTIIGKDATLCDAFSTAILAEGQNLAEKLKEKYDFEYIILKDKTITLSDGIEICDIKEGYVVNQQEKH